MTTKTRTTKADAIRKHMAGNPKASPTETAEALRKTYKDITPQYVSTIKSMDKRKASGPVRRGELTAEDMLATRDFVRGMGGSARAAEAIGILEKLAG